MYGENALKEVMWKVLQKVQVGVGEDWEACWKRWWVAVYVPAFISVKTDHLFLVTRGHLRAFRCSSWIAGSSRLCQLIFWKLTCVRHNPTWWPSFDGVRIMTWSLHYKLCKLKGSYVFLMHSLHFQFMFQTYFDTLKPKPMKHKRPSFRQERVREKTRNCF
jgi:hypothetical protein